MELMRPPRLVKSAPIAPLLIKEIKSMKAGQALPLGRVRQQKLSSTTEKYIVSYFSSLLFSYKAKVLVIIFCH